MFFIKIVLRCLKIKRCLSFLPRQSAKGMFSAAIIWRCWDRRTELGTNYIPCYIHNHLDADRTSSKARMVPLTVSSSCSNCWTWKESRWLLQAEENMFLTGPPGCWGKCQEPKHLVRLWSGEQLTLARCPSSPPAPLWLWPKCQKVQTERSSIVGSAKWTPATLKTHWIKTLHLRS